MNKQLFDKAIGLASRNYEVQISEDVLSSGQPVFMAKNPELFGCMAQGFSKDEAIINLFDARIDYIYDSLKDGAPIPDPKIMPRNEVITQVFNFNFNDKSIKNIQTYKSQTIDHSCLVLANTPV